jgi:hypothetical protein
MCPSLFGQDKAIILCCVCLSEEKAWQKSQIHVCAIIITWFKMSFYYPMILSRYYMRLHHESRGFFAIHVVHCSREINGCLCAKQVCCPAYWQNSICKCELYCYNERRFVGYTQFCRRESRVEKGERGMSVRHFIVDAGKQIDSSIACRCRHTSQTRFEEDICSSDVSLCTRAIHQQPWYAGCRLHRTAEQ